MKILLYGGTFDPPHKGHLHLLESAMEYLQPDKVVVMPAGVPPHKKASATPSSIRLAMCRCFETLGKQVQLSDWEISRKGKNYTVDTIGHLRQCYPHGKIYLCIGGDMLTSFTAWKDWQRLLRWCTLVALCRDSGQMEPFEQGCKNCGVAGVSGEAVLHRPAQTVDSRKFGKEIATKTGGRGCGKIWVVSTEGGESMTEQQAEQLAKETLSPKRLQHTLNVRDVAVELAKQYGADVHKAAVAALLHDIAKEMTREEMLQIFSHNAIMACDAPQKPFPVWHGFCAAILAKVKWGVEDEEILSAIRCHTTGKPGMTLLDKIIFLADMTSAERNYPEVEYLRKLEREDIHLAMRTAMEMNIQWLQQSGKPVDETSLQTLEDLRHNQNKGDLVL